VTNTYLSFSSTGDPPPELHPLPPHDAVPISILTQPTARMAGARATSPSSSRSMSRSRLTTAWTRPASSQRGRARVVILRASSGRSEEHTSELQSRENLVCRLVLERKKLQLTL